MAEIIPINSSTDIFPEYLSTPIAKLLEYHNLDHDLDRYERAELLVGMCMDNRKQLRLPDNFAYVLRTSGPNGPHHGFHAATDARAPRATPNAEQALESDRPTDSPRTQD